MIESTRAIALHQIRYSDSGIVVQFFTHKFGRISCLIRGMGNRKSGKHYVLFQPLSILEISIYYKSSREIQSIKDFTVSYSPADIYSNVRKSSVAIFMGEVLTTVVREESPNESLFSFLENSIIFYDKCREGFANFHLSFIATLCTYLGFEPGKGKTGESKYFDMLNGIFVQAPPEHKDYANAAISEILVALFSSSFEKANEIILTGSMRNQVLDTLIEYFSLHLPGLKKINSLEVLREVFN
jgi:DNA repair protein RecO (recombination protein O)